MSQADESGRLRRTGGGATILFLVTHSAGIHETFGCLLARRRRAGEVTRSIEARGHATFEKDVGAGFLQVYPAADEHLIAALNLIERLGRYPLRTLDALHLAIADANDCRRLATADRTMADAAKALGFDIARFY